MSKLIRTAQRFDQTPCNDAYTGSFLFNGQLKAWPEVLRDSEVAARRVLSCAPSIMMPSRRAIAVGSDVYLIGSGNTDQWKGQPIRVGYPATKADGLAVLSGLDQLCLGQNGIQVYTGKSWIKNDAFTQQDSHLNPKHQVFFSNSETITPGKAVILGSTMMLIRAVYEAPTGLIIADCDEMMLPNVTAVTLETKVFDPVSNTSSSSTTSVTVVRLRWQSMFQYMASSSPTFKSGDEQAVVAKSVASPTIGSVFVMPDGRWRVESILDNGTTWVCRVCRGG